jgi:hypothetical protein
MSIVLNPNTGNYCLLVNLDGYEGIVISEGSYREMEVYKYNMEKVY